LRAVIAHAYEKVPYYRRAFDAIRLKPADIRRCADLPKIPLIRRADIRAHFDDLRSREVPALKLKTGHTSGTTGTPATATTAGV
jgi:phenylacetate-CoA ligase